MRPISKQTEPVSLVEHRCTIHATFDNLDKDETRLSLLREQYGLCCYCMRRIRYDRDDPNSSKQTKIEHWHSQTNYPDEQLDYGNILLACTGGEGTPRGKQHCDTYKGNSALARNPADPAHLINRDITYLRDGTIKSSDSDFDDQLNSVLHLNVTFLKKNRKSVLDSILDWFKKERTLTKSMLEREISKKRTPENHELPEYCEVAVYWLERRLRKMP